MQVVIYSNTIAGNLTCVTYQRICLIHIFITNPSKTHTKQTNKLEKSWIAINLIIFSYVYQFNCWEGVKLDYFFATVLPCIWNCNFKVIVNYQIANTCLFFHLFTILVAGKSRSWIFLCVYTTALAGRIEYVIKWNFIGGGLEI